MGNESASNRPTTQPTSQSFEKNALFERIQAVYRSGMSRRQLADAAGLTQFQAWKFLKEIQTLDPR